MCLVMPRFSAELARRRCDLPADRPVALAEQAGQSRRVAACCRRAAAGGVRCGQSVAEAGAILPGLVVCSYDRQADRRRLEELAIGAMRFSPIVQPVEPAELLLDVTGCRRLFGGEDRLLELALGYVEAQGLSVLGAIAGTVGAAWAVAHAGGGQEVVIADGQEVAALAGLPTWSLRLGAEVVEALRRLGIATVDDLMHLPRSSLVSRFGRAVLERLDQAVGAVDESVEPYRAMQLPTVRMPLAFPTDRQEVVRAAVEHLVGQVARRLERLGQGVSWLDCTFYREQAKPVTMAISLTRPRRDVAGLMSLLAVRVESLDLSVPVSAISLHVTRMGPIQRRQGRLFEPAEVDNPQRMAGLLDELSNRMGPKAVVRARLIDEHQPEYACRYEPVVAGGVCSQQRSRRGLLAKSPTLAVARMGHPSRAAGGPSGKAVEGDGGRRLPSALAGKPPVAPTVTPMSPGDRPVRLLSQPEVIDVIAGSVDARPAWFRWRSRRHEVAWARGPERIETGWWRGRQVCRDYYVVQDEEGGRFWLFRDRQSRRWFLHGCFE